MRQQIEAAAQVIRNSGEMIGMSEPWMILPEEMSQLGITLDEWPQLAATYDAYLAFMDIVAPEDVGFDDDTIAAERERWSHYANSGCTVSVDSFAAMARAWAGITAEQAAKLTRK